MPWITAPVAILLDRSDSISPQARDEQEQWLAKAQKHTGTWWEVWAEWTLERSGKDKPVPGTLGSAHHPIVDKAPGQYVHQPA